MTCYKVTCMFSPDWRTMFKAMFGDAVHSSSEESPNVSIYRFDDPVTPNDMGPLVIVEQVEQSVRLLSQ